MTVTYGFKKVCAKHPDIDLKYMKIWGNRIPYCTKCHAPIKKKFNHLPKEAYVQMADKAKVRKEVWSGKQAEKIVAKKKKKVANPHKMLNVNSVLNDRWIRSQRKIKKSKNI